MRAQIFRKLDSNFRGSRADWRLPLTRATRCVARPLPQAGEVTQSATSPVHGRGRKCEAFPGEGNERRAASLGRGRPGVALSNPQFALGEVAGRFVVSLAVRRAQIDAR